MPRKKSDIFVLPWVLKRGFTVSLANIDLSQKSAKLMKAFAKGEMYGIKEES